MASSLKRLPARFYETPSGAEPVRVWLQGFDVDDRRALGEAIALVEFGWPVGMPVCRRLQGTADLWEIRISLSRGRIARIIFCVREGSAVLLHGFEKKTQKTPKQDIDLAGQREKELE